MLNSSLVSAQSNDPQDSLPSHTYGLDDGNSFKPINPQPFKRCEIIINRDLVSGKLTLEAILKNLGYKSNVKFVDSSVVMTIDAVAESVRAHNRAPVLLPYKFVLYVIIDSLDTAKFQIEYRREQDILVASPDPRLQSKHISIEPMKRVRDVLCWVLFDGNKMPAGFKKEIEQVATIQVLEGGYYWGLPYPVKSKKERRGSYNQISDRRVVFLKLLDGSSSAPVLDGLLRQYRLAGRIIASGYLNPVLISAERREK